MGGYFVQFIQTARLFFSYAFMLILVGVFIMGHIN